MVSGSRGHLTQNPPRRRTPPRQIGRLAADPRAALHVTSQDFLSFVVAEDEAEVSPVSDVPGDKIGRELLAMQLGSDTPPTSRCF